MGCTHAHDRNPTHTVPMQTHRLWQTFTYTLHLRLNVSLFYTLKFSFLGGVCSGGRVCYVADNFLILAVNGLPDFSTIVMNAAEMSQEKVRAGLNPCVK